MFSQCGLAIGMLYVAATQRVYAGFRHWTAFFVSMPLVFALLAIRDYQPLFFSTVMVNALAFGGVIALMEGTRRFAGEEGIRPLRLNLAFATVGLLGVSWFTFVSPSVSGRLVFHNAITVALCLHAAFRPWFYVNKPPRSFRIHTFTFAVFGLFALIRLTRAISTDFTDLFTEGWSYNTMLILLMLLNVFTMMGCLIMTNERSLLDAKAARRSLQTLLSNLRGVAYRVRISGDEEEIEYASGGAQALSGYPPEFFAGMKLKDYRKLIDPADLEANRVAVVSALAENRHYTVTYRIKDGTGRTRWVWDQGVGIRDEDGRLVSREGYISDITAQVEAAAENERLVGELRRALSEVKTLTGLIPICASCKKIRDDKGYWNNLEIYISEHTGADFTHGICPDCIERLYPQK